MVHEHDHWFWFLYWLINFNFILKWKWPCTPPAGLIINVLSRIIIWFNKKIFINVWIFTRGYIYIWYARQCNIVKVEVRRVDRKKMEGYRLGELRHMLTTVFLSGFAESLVRPAMTDVTVAAVCSGVNDSCSLAIYLTGVQQVVTTYMYIHIYLYRCYHRSSTVIVFTLIFLFFLFNDSLIFWA